MLKGKPSRAYSTKTQQKIWTMVLRSDLSKEIDEILPLRIGGTSLSPSGERLAVLNLKDGIDWYSTSHQRYMMTTRYSSYLPAFETNRVVGVEFLDEDTVVAGHPNGYLIFASFGMSTSPQFKQLAKTNQC